MFKKSQKIWQLISKQDKRASIENVKPSHKETAKISHKDKTQVVSRNIPKLSMSKSQIHIAPSANEEQSFIFSWKENALKELTSTYQSISNVNENTSQSKIKHHKLSGLDRNPNMSKSPFRMNEGPSNRAIRSYVDLENKSFGSGRNSGELVRQSVGKQLTSLTALVDEYITGKTPKKG